MRSCVYPGHGTSRGLDSGLRRSDVMPAPAFARAGCGRHPVFWLYAVHENEICSKHLPLSDIFGG